MRRITRITAVATLAAFPLGLAACGSDDTDTTSTTTTTTSSSAPSSSSDMSSSGDMSSSDDMSSSTTSTTSSSSSSSGTAMGEAPFGEACSAVPEDGSGSFDGMAKDPVATAASNNPVLSTLVTAVTKADLADTLNSAKDITVFAPTNDAFAAMDKATMDKAMGDPKGLLTTVLTHHVVEGRLSPQDLAGTHTTLAGDEVTVKGSGEDFTVGKAKVVCGNVQTANATVYIIDDVLMPTAK